MWQIIKWDGRLWDRQKYDLPSTIYHLPSVSHNQPSTISLTHKWEIRWKLKSDSPPKWKTNQIYQPSMRQIMRQIWDGIRFYDKICDVINLSSLLWYGKWFSLSPSTISNSSFSWFLISSNNNFKSFECWER